MQYKQLDGGAILGPEYMYVGIRILI